MLSRGKSEVNLMDGMSGKNNHNEEDKKLLLAYQELISGMDIAMWRWDLQSEVLTPFFGVETLIGNHDLNALTKTGFWISQWHPEDRITINNKVDEAIKHQHSKIDFIHRIRHKDGYYVWISTKATIEYDHDDAKSLLGISMNIDKIHQTMMNLNIEKENFKKIIRATNAATWVWNVQTGETVFDEQWAKMLGYTLDELKPINIKTWEKLVHPDDLMKAYEVIKDVLDQKTDHYVSEYRMRHKDGHDVWISDRGNIITYTDDGKPKDMAGIHLDISKRRKLEYNLAKSEKHYKFLIESSYDIIYTLDLDANITFVSDAWNRQLQHTTENTLNKNINDFIHPDDLPRLQQFFVHIEKTGEHIAIEEFRLRTEDNKYRFYNTNASIMTDDNGNVTGYVGTARDITGRKQLQDQLALERDLFKKTLLSVGDAIVSTDRFGHIVIMNQNAEKMLGYAETEAKSQVLWDVMVLFFEDSKNGRAHSLETLIKATETIYIQSATLLNAKGKQIHIELSIAPIQDAKRVNEGVVIIFRDISEKQRKQKEIEFLSYHDYLTGLYNRRYMDQTIQDLDKDRFLPLGMMILDVNDLKEMNDEFGHQAGDDLLKKVSRIIESHLESKDTLGRIGGDEFLILLPNTSEQQIYELKHRLIEAFEKEKVRDKKITVALGYAIKTDVDQDIYETMKQADDYMYADKDKRS